MALEKIDTDKNFSGVTGVFTGQGNTPMFLGEQKNSFSLNDYFGSANIVVGFDTRISPAQVRIFYQNNNPISINAPDKHYGLMMTKQISFNGLPIPPSVYSAAIRHQDHYSSFKKNSPFRIERVSKAYAVEMLPPNEFVQHGLIDPYFAYNAVLHESGFKMEDVYKVNTVNGFLAHYADTGQREQPQCASLFAPLAIDVEAPFASTIYQFIENLKDNKIEPVATVEITDQEISDGLLLDRVLNIDGQSIPLEDVVDMKMIGEYLVITLQDEENYYPVLVVDPFQKGKKPVYLYDIDLMDDLQKRHTRTLFNRMTIFFKSNNRFASNFGSWTNTASESLKEQVIRMRSEEPHHVSCDYRVYAVERWTIPGTQRLAHHCTGGLQFSVKRKFHREQLQFAELEINRPTALPIDEVIKFNQQHYEIHHPSFRDTNSYMPELIKYYQSLKTEFPISINTLQRFRTYPPLSSTIIK